MIANLTMTPNGLDVRTWQALHDTLSLDDALDLLEIEQVRRSWNRAHNANDRAARDAARGR